MGLRLTLGASVKAIFLACIAWIVQRVALASDLPTKARSTERQSHRRRTTGQDFMLARISAEDGPTAANIPAHFCGGIIEFRRRAGRLNFQAGHLLSVPKAID
jgi:hypothetical protein